MTEMRRVAKSSVSRPRRHVVITGTGRAGTSFLVQLLTHCGLDTGFALDELFLNEIPNAGLERDIRQDNAPYIVKSPHMTGYMSSVLKNPAMLIEHAIIPVRALDDAARSRIRVAKLSRDLIGRNGPGGLWGTNSSRGQRGILAEKFTDCVVDLVEADVPVTFLYFPRFAKDADYCYAKLAPIFPALDADVFQRAFTETADPHLVHSFGEPLPDISFHWQSAIARMKYWRDRLRRAVAQ